MAYRSLRGVLVETSLELKCLFLFGTFLLLVIAVSVMLYWRVTEAVVTQQNPATARLLVDQVMLLHHWLGMEGMEAPGAIDRDENDYRFLVKGLLEKLRREEYDWAFIEPPGRYVGISKLARPPKGDWEEALLARYMSMSPDAAVVDGRPAYDHRTVANGQVYQYFEPVYATNKSCGACHDLVLARGYNPLVADPVEPLNVGDLVAIIQVNIPNGPTQAAITYYWSMLLAVAIITTFLAMIAFYVTIRYVIVRPLRHLRAVSDSISRGNTSLRAKINTGDEFESLAAAFNRMLGHLVAVQDELRQVNTDLDLKVDELAQLNMQLYEMNRVKSDFMATMSHELRTPLNSILGFSDVLGSIDSLDERQKRYVEHIKKSGRMLLEMINNILDLAKIEAGRMDVRLSEFAVEPVVAAQCDMARPLTERKNIDLDARVEPGLPPLHQDQSRVQQILNNLLSNAIKFTPEGGRIEVAAQRDGRGELVLRVSDTGVGIADEDQHVIFEKFRQGRTAVPDGDAMTREYSGTGLGLSIVRELCRLLGGEVSVESQLGVGSTFTVRLPWRLERPSAADSPVAAGLAEFGKTPPPAIRPRGDMPETFAPLGEEP